MPWKRFLSVLSLAVAAAVPAFGGDPAESEKAPKAYAIGDKVADIVAKDLDGRDFRLYGLSATKETAWAAVLEVAKDYGAPADAKPATTLASLPLVKGDDNVVDPGLVAELVAKAGKRVGMISNEAHASGLKTLGDVASWIEKGAKAPIVIHV